ncbi:hypothetical protein D9613_004043 [Agrocybe pediades]|uniref:Ribosomal protein S19 n=1 Tax=Agrocybe pediades TaxID=84607 RepID=A0A8H4QIU4_9AGAR|nr:hypothetical protein D9613_004043 [Agrocybe pediades]
MSLLPLSHDIAEKHPILVVVVVRDSEQAISEDAPNPIITQDRKVRLESYLGPYFVPFQNLRDALANHTAIMTQARSCTILPNFVGVRFLVHNGRDYLPVLVTQDMVGHKLGEFAITKKRFTFRQTKK